MRVGIVGGGGIGLCTAYYLKKMVRTPSSSSRRLWATVARTEMLVGCSRLKSTPLAKPGLTFAVSEVDAAAGQARCTSSRPALLALAPWLMRFRAHCNHAAQKQGIAALAALNAVTMDRYDELAADGVQFEYFRVGGC